MPTGSACTSGTTGTRWSAMNTGRGILCLSCGPTRDTSSSGSPSTGHDRRLDFLNTSRLGLTVTFELGEVRIYEMGPLHQFGGMARGAALAREIGVEDRHQELGQEHVDEHAAH